ncbi:MAG: O-antigen ligase family protein [Chloroflexi bacterium]|nr:O-antigen ligase family protein [Chloroflexota bacterium]
MNYAIVFVNLIALVVLIRRRRLPAPFPWRATIALALVLLLGGLSTGIERGVAFVTLITAMVVTREVIPNTRKALFVIACLLTAFILADAFRLIPTPDIQVTSGETFGVVRRPYLLEHPNLKASWLLLMTMSPVALIGIIATQSRGALLGFISAVALRITPRRYYAIAFAACVVVMSLAAAVRPGTFFWRMDAWGEAFNIFLSNPLLGVGTGNYITYAASGMSIAHNAALTILAENGLIGLAVFAAWLIPVVVMVARSKSTAKYSLLAFAVQQIVDDQWLHPVSAILLGMVLALCIKPYDAQ